MLRYFTMLFVMVLVSTGTVNAQSQLFDDTTPENVQSLDSGAAGAKRLGPIIPAPGSPTPFPPPIPTIPTVQRGSITPKYSVVGVIYAPPGSTSGQRSFVEYSQTSQLGTAVSVADSFRYGTQLTANASFLGASLGASLGLSTTVTDQTSTELRLGQGRTLRYTGSAGRDGINHDEDLIVLWLNPQVNFTVFGTSIAWNLGTPNNQPVRIFQVQVGYLKDPSIMPVAVRTVLETAGIYPSEYTRILSHNPFAYADNPVLDPRRFVRANSTLPYIPPLDPRGALAAYTWTENSTFTVSTTNMFENAYSVGFTYGTGFDIDIVKISLKLDKSWTWTNKTATTKSTSKSQSATFSILPPGYGYTGVSEIGVYWDLLYGSYVFVPLNPSWTTDGSFKPTSRATITGVALDASNNPVVSREVLLRDSTGTSYRTFTTPSGNFTFHEIPAGNCRITIGDAHESVHVSLPSTYVLVHLK